jgi:glutathione S-transferase
VPTKFRLITIPISHYSEKVRWGLDYLQIPFQELPQMPPFHRLATGKYGGKTTPVMITDTGKIVTDSTESLRYLDTLYPGKLYRPDPELQTLTTELEILFNRTLGVHTRRWGYSQILTPQMIYSRWTVGVPAWQKSFFPIVFPKMRSMIQSTMKITATSASESYQKIERVFDRVDQVLSDGRQYLLGDRFSAIDITFAALAVPILQPPQQHIPPSQRDVLPLQMQAEISHFQATRAGEFGLRLYRESRHH